MDQRKLLPFISHRCTRFSRIPKTPRRRGEYMTLEEAMNSGFNEEASYQREVRVKTVQELRVAKSRGIQAKEQTRDFELVKITLYENQQQEWNGMELLQIPQIGRTILWDQCHR
eukprot:TRINITY_DN1732_c0_g1_i1.p1 TRINITY_DN1732_c0_g1~~TRINITY_DN1732_c0_g1_i1.p1  ORF type:complete len:114 (+),score=6.43 TRINITY_DN1732_c0_g1_i1:191-532(+)